MKYLQPIIDRESYHLEVERLIKQFLYHTIYKPVLDIAQSNIPKVFENSKNELIRAIRTGNIVYKDGFFTGTFNSSVGLEMRKLGATFNHTRKAYAIDRSLLPMDVKSAINEGTKLIEERVKEIYKKLEDLQKNTEIKYISFEKPVAYMLEGLDKQFDTTLLKPLKKDISIPMTMSPYVKEAIEKDYTKNLNLYINDWYDTAIIRLRQKVHKNVEEGYRATNLIPIIQAEKNVSYNKAKFLARQETSILVSTYREKRYSEAGVRKYKWSTSNDSRVRPNAEARKTGNTENNHRILNNRIFSFNDPPIVDSATGRRCNPGMDYGCRCVAIPILPDDK